MIKENRIFDVVLVWGIIALCAVGMALAVRAICGIISLIK